MTVAAGRRSAATRAGLLSAGRAARGWLGGARLGLAVMALLVGAGAGLGAAAFGG